MSDDDQAGRIKTGSVLRLTSAISLLAVSIVLMGSGPSFPFSQFRISGQEPHAILVMTIKDEANQPVRSAVAVVSGADFTTESSDVAGQVQVEVTPGSWEISVVHETLVILPTSRTVTVGPGQRCQAEFRALRRTARISGTLKLIQPPSTISVGGVLGLQAAVYPTDLSAGSLPVAIVAFDEDTMSYAAAVPAGQWRVRVVEIPQGMKVATVSVRDGEEATADLEVDFSRLTGFQGLAIEAGLYMERIGPPFEMTTVGIYEIRENRTPHLVTTTWGRSRPTYGVFAQVPEGREIGAFAWRAGASAVPASIRTKAKLASAYFGDFQFVPNSGTLTGTLVDSRGRPVTDAWIAIAAGARFEPWMFWGRPIHVLGGLFRVRVPLGRVMVWASKSPEGMGNPAMITVTTSDPVRVRLVVE